MRHLDLLAGLNVPDLESLNWGVDTDIGRETDEESAIAGESKVVAVVGGRQRRRRGHRSYELPGERVPYLWRADRLAYDGVLAVRCHRHACDVRELVVGRIGRVLREEERAHGEVAC